MFKWGKSKAREELPQWVYLKALDLMKRHGKNEILARTSRLC